MKKIITIIALNVIIINIFNISPIYAIIPEQERLSLIDIYNSNSGDNWNNNDGWLGEKGSECSWFGISCDDEQNHVVKLNLRNNKLTTVPPTIENLKDLTELDLSYNLLTNLSHEIENLNNLNYLFLNNNKLNSLSPEIGKLSNLKWLYLSSNNLTNLPEEISSLTNLYYLNLTANKLLSLPNNFSNLKNLRFCLLSYNALDLSDSKTIEFIDNLQNDWKETQTVPPKQLMITNETETSLLLTWAAINYTNNEGGYEVYYSKTDSHSYTRYCFKEDKSIEQIKITGLSSNTTYYFKVRSFTYPHTMSSISHFNNYNIVYSKFSNEISAKTISMIASSDVKLFSSYDSGISKNDQITNIREVKVIGSCENESKIEVFVDNMLTNLQNIIICTNNEFSANLILPEGINVITAIQIDPSNNLSKPSAPLTITVDTQVNNFEIEQTDFINENLCSWALDIENITLSGNREPGSTITINCLNASQIDIFYPDNSTWEAELTDMPTGQYTVVIHATDIAGNVASIEKTIYRLKPQEVIIESPDEMIADGTSILPLKFSFFSEGQHELCANKYVDITSSTGYIFENTKYVDSHHLFCDYQSGLELVKTNISVYYHNKMLGSKTIDMIAGPINRMVLIVDKTFQEIDMPGQFIKLQTQDGYGHPVPVHNDLNITLESTAKSKGEFSILQDYWNWQKGSATLLFASGKNEVLFKYKSSLPGIYTIKASEYPDVGLYDATLKIQIIDQPIATLQTPPLSITNTTDFQFYVQGDYVSAYQYQLNQNEWQHCQRQL